MIVNEVRCRRMTLVDEHNGETLCEIFFSELGIFWHRLDNDAWKRITHGVPSDCFGDNYKELGYEQD